jgi:hypothetical protein
MPSSKSTPKKPAPHRGSKSSGSGELKSDDLDKVRGGMKPLGGATIGKTSTLSEDPCMGGE